MLRAGVRRIGLILRSGVRSIGLVLRAGRSRGGVEESSLRLGLLGDIVDKVTIVDETRSFGCGDITPYVLPFEILGYV